MMPRLIAPILGVLLASTFTAANIDADRGSALAFFTALFDIGVLVGGPMLGVIISVSGYPAMYGFAAVVMAVSTVIYWRWDRRYDYKDQAEDVPAPTA